MKIGALNTHPGDGDSTEPYFATLTNKVLDIELGALLLSLETFEAMPKHSKLSSADSFTVKNTEERQNSENAPGTPTHRRKDSYKFEDSDPITNPHTDSDQ